MHFLGLYSVYFTNQYTLLITYESLSYFYIINIVHLVAEVNWVH